MKFTLFLILFSINSVVIAANKVVYGRDSRVNSTVIEDFWKNRAAATAALIKKSKLSLAGNKYHSKRVMTLGERYSLCDGQSFKDEPVLSDCTGFLISEDTLVTAGHCLMQMPYPYWGNSQKVCDDFAWSFDFDLMSINEQGITLKAPYNCKKIIHAEYQGLKDFAIIQLDRKVLGVAPLKLAPKDIRPGMLTMIGHPSGLPKKLSHSGRVIEYNGKSDRFLATLDSFQGNSGSPVFNDQGDVVGILVSGKTDYTYDVTNQCQRVNTCNDQGIDCSDARDFVKAEGVVKVKIIKDRIKTVH